MFFYLTNLKGTCSEKKFKGSISPCHTRAQIYKQGCVKFTLIVKFNFKIIPLKKSCVRYKLIKYLNYFLQIAII